MQEQFLDLLFNFKHRGAIEKAAESFQLFCVKLLESKDPYYRSLPHLMLERALEKITTENLSTVLRRSAGIPPTIIAILRAEPISQEPALLNKAIGFLLDLAKNADKDDSKIHALNIMRFIFQDSMLRHDIQRFITPAMILATESFSSNNWSIRNSALMAFTALTKRLLNNLHVQDQDLARTKGLSVWDFLSKYQELSAYFLAKLRQGLEPGSRRREDKEKEDLVIFSILLLISRLIPSFQLVELDGGSTHDREARIAEYVTLIKRYSGNATYFVRKISAQAILPLIKFDDYALKELPLCFQEFEASLGDGKRLRQNEAHGLMVRINVFLSAYLQYREGAAKQLGPGHHQDQAGHRQEEEKTLVQCFEGFQSKLEAVSAVYSKVTVALFIKTFTKLVNNLPDYTPTASIVQAYEERFAQLVATFTESKERLMGGDEQILLQEVARFLVVHCMRRDTAKAFKIFTTIVDHFTDQYSDFVYTFLGQYLTALKRSRDSDLLSSLGSYLSEHALPAALKRSEKYCKVTEMLLKTAHTCLKSSGQSPPVACLFDLMTRFGTNPSILSHVIKLLALALLINKSNNTLFVKVTGILAGYCTMEHKEQVRIAVSKALAKVLTLLAETIDESRLSGQLSMLYALVILLNDEQPDIRYYLCESPALSQVIDFENLQPWKVLADGYTVKLNDMFVLETLFANFTRRLQSQAPHLVPLYVRDFLVKNWIEGNPYRDHLEKNFEDKIFFFEPINKFFDLLWVKRLAFREALKLGCYHNGAAVAKDFAYTDVMKHTSQSYEALV